METDPLAPSSTDEHDIRAQLRAQQIRVVNLEAQVSVTKLTLEHAREDIAAARRACAEYRARYEAAEGELAGVRAKYAELKRRWAKREECRERDAHIAACEENADAVLPARPETQRVPGTNQDTNRQRETHVLHKTSIDERYNKRPPNRESQDPVACDNLISLSNASDRGQDPRKRTKLDMRISIPVLDPASSMSASPKQCPTPPLANVSASNAGTKDRFPSSHRPLAIGVTPGPEKTEQGPGSRSSCTKSSWLIRDILRRILLSNVPVQSRLNSVSAEPYDK
ncbi:hypothetical protein GGX14DRAFT_602966 [Mycena pura]|uniref:Uncharacterized protein n=1 Tax=Mycena pura TaxID=153505 RepID=A0AAD6VNW6_9AGAR|nr:hypothetical protein GGX14DRAFT_602966 [Mycena pura]